MSVEQDGVLEVPQAKTSIFTKIKIALAVLLVFSLVLVGTTGLLYFTNARAKSIINRQIQAHKVRKELKAKTQGSASGDPRVSELAKYYMDMSTEDASKKMLEIKKSDKKAYEKILSSMNVINPDKSSDIQAMIKSMDSKTDVIKTEYSTMEEAKKTDSTALAKYYNKLGIKGSIDAIQKDLQSSMDYDKITNALVTMKALTVAKILYYMNPMYIDGIKSRFPKSFNKSVEQELQNYSEFLRKYSSLGELYGKTEEKMAAKELQDDTKFKVEQLATIFANMDYLNAAKILNEFEDETKVQDVLKEIKNVEDYQTNFDGSYSTVVANSIKVLKKYREDVDTLRKAYEKMQATDLASIIDKLITASPVYRNYKIDNMRNFSITEKQMAIDALKKMKPALVGDLLAQLKNDNKVDKAAYISREIGIPDSAN